ncbi:MAG: hypothetical protein ACREQO_27555 [Candidatus Binatia bacterium]
MISFVAWGATVKIWPGEILGLAMIAGAIIFFWRATISKDNPINFNEMFVWPGTKHTSMAMFLAFCGSMGGLWVVFDQEFRKSLSTELFLGLMGILIFGKGLTEFINAWRAKDNPSPPPPPPPAQIIGSANVANQMAPPIIPDGAKSAASKRKRKKGR